MARPKSAAPAGQLFSIRGRLEWAQWVEGLRRHCDRPSVAVNSIGERQPPDPPVITRKAGGVWRAYSTAGPPGSVGLGRTRKDAIEAHRRRLARKAAAFQATYGRRGKGEPGVRMKRLDRHGDRYCLDF